MIVPVLSINPANHPFIHLSSHQAKPGLWICQTVRLSHPFSYPPAYTSDICLIISPILLPTRLHVRYVSDYLPLSLTHPPTRQICVWLSHPFFNSPAYLPLSTHLQDMSDMCHYLTRSPTHPYLPLSTRLQDVSDMCHYLTRSPTHPYTPLSTRLQDMSDMCHYLTRSPIHPYVPLSLHWSLRELSYSLFP